MNEELVKALREEALALHVAGWRDPAGGQDTTISAVLADDAADRIEALTAQLESTLRDRKAILGERDLLRAVLSDIKTASVCGVSRHVAASALGEAAA